MIIGFMVLTIILAVLRVLFGYFSSAVGFFEPLLTPLLVAAIISGCVAFIFITIRICGDIKKLFGKRKKKDDEE